MDRDKLVLDNLKLVNQVLHDKYPSIAFDEDLIQEGRLALVRAAQKYDPDKGIKFSSYAYPAILHHYYHIMRARFSPKRYHMEIDVDLERYLEEEERFYVNDPVNFESFLAQLSELDKTIVLYRVVDGYTHNQIADILGCTHQYISLRLKKIRKVFDEFI